VQVVHTDPSEVSHLVIGENFLARFDGNHGLALFSLRLPVPTLLDADRILGAAIYKSNSRSVSHAKNDSASTSRLESRRNTLFCTLRDKDAR
jgi:hypothetical protein